MNTVQEGCVLILSKNRYKQNGGHTEGLAKHPHTGDDLVDVLHGLTMALSRHFLRKSLMELRVNGFPI
jgi:hypothetical protein